MGRVWGPGAEHPDRDDRGSVMGYWVIPSELLERRWIILDNFMFGVLENSYRPMRIPYGGI